MPCQRCLRSQTGLQDVCPVFLLTTIRHSLKLGLQLQEPGDWAVKTKHVLKIYVVKFPRIGKMAVQFKFQKNLSNKGKNCWHLRCKHCLQNHNYKNKCTANLLPSKNYFPNKLKDNQITIQETKVLQFLTFQQ